MASYTYIGTDGVSYGPYTLEQMRAFKAQNRLAHHSQVSADGGALKPASSHPELMFEAGAPGPPVVMPGSGMGVPVQNAGGPQTYDQVPWFRREGTMSIFIVLGFCLCAPFLWAACIIILSGDIYKKSFDQHGNLQTWSVGNKIAAGILLALHTLGFISILVSQ